MAQEQLTTTRTWKLSMVHYLNDKYSTMYSRKFKLFWRSSSNHV